MGEGEGETGGEDTKEKPINLTYIADLLNRIDNHCDDGTEMRYTKPSLRSN